jgi:hypothetical protein
MCPRCSPGEYRTRTGSRRVRGTSSTCGATAARASGACCPCERCAGACRCVYYCLIVQLYCLIVPWVVCVRSGPGRRKSGDRGHREGVVACERRARLEMRPGQAVRQIRGAKLCRSCFLSGHKLRALRTTAASMAVRSRAALFEGSVAPNPPASSVKRRAALFQSPEAADNTHLQSLGARCFAWTGSGVDGLGL